jgi:hypothetical protein
VRAGRVGWWWAVFWRSSKSRGYWWGEDLVETGGHLAGYRLSKGNNVFETNKNSVVGTDFWKSLLEKFSVYQTSKVN